MTEIQSPAEVSEKMNIFSVPKYLSNFPSILTIPVELILSKISPPFCSTALATTPHTQELLPLDSKGRNCNLIQSIHPESRTPTNLGKSVPKNTREKLEYAPVIQLYPFHAVEMQDGQYYCHQEYNGTAHAHADVKHAGGSGGSCVYRIDWKRKVESY